MLREFVAVAAVAAVAASGHGASHAQHHNHTDADRPTAVHKPAPTPRPTPHSVAKQPGLSRSATSGRDDRFAGEPVVEGTEESVLCDGPRVVDYWPHQDWMKKKAPGECRKEDQFSDQLVHGVNELERAKGADQG